MSLNLEHLKTLKILDESGNFAKAATKLNKVRSAVSYDIRCLENHLGISLLDRSGYRTQLNEIGKMIAARSRHILREARALEHLASLLHQQWEPTLKVVIEGAIPNRPVMRVIQELNAQNVPTRINLQTEFLSGVPDRFEKEEADLMLVKNFEAQWEDYEVFELPPVHCFLVAASTHDLFAKNPTTISLQELCKHVELNIEVSADNAAQMGDKRLGSPRVLNLSGFHTKKEALLMGLGFGWMPGALIGEELANNRLHVIPFDEGSSFHFVPLLMYKKERPLGRSGSLFKELLVKEFQSIDKEFGNEDSQD